MATQLFFLDDGGLQVEGVRGKAATPLVGASQAAWQPMRLATTRGDGVVSSSATSTVAGTTAGIEIQRGIRAEWISPPVDADVTISGAVTGNLWASESNMSANVAINFVIDVIRSVDNSIVNIVTSARTTELGTSAAAANFTATPGSGVLVNKGDRIRCRVFGDDAGTMASGFTFTFRFDGATGGADGDSYISFTETFGFMADPSGTQLFLTDTASDVSTASVDREAWTSRGSGVLDDILACAAGTTELQLTDTNGGTVVDWFTKQLQAFTLAGKIECNLRAKVSANNNSTLRVEIARVDSDGTNPTVWATVCAEHQNVTGRLTTTETAWKVWPAADDMAFTDGQRIRIRVINNYDQGASARTGGETMTFYYNGTSGGASGDSWVTLPVTVAEFTGGGGDPEMVEFPIEGGGYYPG